MLWDFCEVCAETRASSVLKDGNRMPGAQWFIDARFNYAGNLLRSALREKIGSAIRTNTTPRHVPARIVEVPDLPRTINGKLGELAVRNVVHGRPVKNIDALANPESLEYFRDLPELKE